MMIKNLLMYKSFLQPQARSGNSVFIQSVAFSIIWPAESDSLWQNWEPVLFQFFSYALSVQNYHISDLLDTNLLLGAQWSSLCHRPTFIKWKTEFFHCNSFHYWLVVQWTFNLCGVFFKQRISCLPKEQGLFIRDVKIFFIPRE